MIAEKSLTEEIFPTNEFVDLEIDFDRACESFGALMKRKLTEAKRVEAENSSIKEEMDGFKREMLEFGERLAKEAQNAKAECMVKDRAIENKSQLIKFLTEEIAEKNKKIFELQGALEASSKGLQPNKGTMFYQEILGKYRSLQSPHHDSEHEDQTGTAKRVKYS